ncbi:phenylpropionate dioxygenase-like ring-hydroxylating dioxygenase large terminal subunit [Methylosinus sp. sav-2]|uniref:aromatic ring-hydroxylating oxygenase subunit alpha n=1 Tax=Methylosinus sp. sav-2 TaxID=2485168 RepID=UPI0006914E4B|nr:aromatic ring-hydroxylating dioxygenase subunit alpha [Methylosinus sp. sav-2]TDX66507.1 phenylpropionate dioxygenase-like ring-hydroxylating dioxygenase large terminal subunit [Methylosinus sp. sav-2]
MADDAAVMMATDADTALSRDIRKTALDPNFWYPVARSEEVRKGKTHRCSFAGDPIVLARGRQGVFALEDRCAHRQVPLSAGVVEEETIRCGYHGWAYDASGACVSLPYATDCSRAATGVRSYPCREAYGLVFVFPGDAARAELTPFPAVPSATDSRYKIRYLNRRAGCHYSFMHENLMDMNHQFLHRRLMGGIKTYFLGSRRGDAWAEATYSFRRVSGRQPFGENFILNRGKWRLKRAPLSAEALATPPGDRMVIRTDYPYQTLKFWTAGASEPALDLWNCYIPVDRAQKINHTFGMIMIKRPAKHSFLLDLFWPAIVWFTNGIFAEDRWICELEQAAFDAQGEDRNQEIFPAILDLRSVLVENGLPLARDRG